jgi:hypothetical protein
MPLHIQAAAAPLYLIIDASQPAATAVGLRLAGNGSGEASGLFTPFTVDDTRHVWGIALRAAGAAAIVTGAPAA